MKFVLAIAAIVALIGVFSVEGASVHAAPSPHTYLSNYARYSPVARADARIYHIPESVFLAQINMESGFNPNALSPGGDEGIAQIAPGTVPLWGINPWNPYAALNAAAYHMGLYAREFGDYRKAIAAYNSGEGTVRWAVRSCGGRWFYCLPGGVQRYVNGIY